MKGPQWAGVLISSISGIIVEMRVKPGDNATIYCDCPRHATYDLLLENITESDLGLYYCALHEIKFTRGRNGESVREDVYHEGNRTTFLSFLAVTDMKGPCAGPPQTPSTLQTPSTPPVSDCSVCWKLLVSVCPACVLLSSVVSSTCVYWIYNSRTKGTLSYRSFSSLNNKTNTMLRAVMENRNVPLTWTNQISAQTSASKTVSITSPPAPVSEMERSRVALITLMCVWFSRISGGEVEVKVRPGDDAVLYCDCVWRSGFLIVWFRNSSHEHMVFHKEDHPRYITVRNLFSRTSDLLVRNVSVLISSISGLIVEMRVKPGDNATIYCDCTYQSKFSLVWFIKPSNEQPPLIHLTEHSTSPHYSRVWNNSKETFDLLVKNITESDLGLYYCALHEIKLTRKEYGARVREDVYHEGNRTTFLSFLGESVHSDLLVGDGGGGDVSYALLNIPKSGQRRLKKRTAESSDLCTYSEVKAERV
ncbi:hypothetical protein NFI96_032248 [Prochilodus magdalenae]|nr:hypothetical protein NFI96_032248 [Prochilodus magdalenae]